MMDIERLWARVGTRVTVGVFSGSHGICEENGGLMAVAHVRRAPLPRFTVAFRRKGAITCLCGASWLAGACDSATPEGKNEFFAEYKLPEWALSNEPILTIGGDDERDGFAIGSAVGAVVIGGRLTLADARFDEVRFYTLGGDLVARVGRDGGGPGEFKEIGGIAVASDTSVAVWDVQLARLTTLSLDGHVLATITPDLSGARSIRPTFVGMTVEGGSVFVDEMPGLSLRTAATGERRDSVRYLFVEPDGTWTGKVRAYPGTEVYFVNEGSMWGHSEILFGRRTVHAISGGHVVIGSTDSLGIWQLNQEGKIVRTARFGWRPQPVKPEWLAAARQALSDETELPSTSFARLNMQISGGMTVEEMDRATERRVEVTPSRATTPAFGGLLGNPLGDTWIAEYDTPDRFERRWVGLDSTLTPFAQIVIDDETDILDLGQSYLVTKSEDELGRQSVHLHAILREPNEER